MKKLILFFITLFLCAGLSAQNSAYEKTIHEDYGTFRMETDDGNVISVGAFTTIEIVDPTAHNDDEVLDVTLNLKQGGGDSKRKELPVPEYHIDIYLVSKSIYDGEGTSTWLDGVKIFIDGKDVRGEQFPDGFLVSVKTEPTLIHSHHTRYKNVDIEIIWETAIYEPRIRK
jgi:hypothetical protein